MKLNTKGLYLRLFSVFSVCEILLFLAFYLNNFIFEYTPVIDTLEYIRRFVDDLIHFAIPCVSAVTVHINYKIGARSDVFAGTAYLTLSRLFYTVPYYYLYHIYVGYDSIESIIASLTVSVIICAVTYLWILLLMLIANISLSFKCKRCGTDQASALSEIEFIDLNAPATFSCAAVVFVAFAAELTEEIINTVIYLIDYSGTYRTSEIIYIAFCFVFLAVKLLCTHILAVLTRKIIFKWRVNSPSEN
jgi:hypothetical protein